jgi:predicted TIM-barrel fold metal-dependent hydrolase
MLHQSAAAGASLFVLRTAVGFAAVNPARTPVDFDIPRGACDCHVHVFDPARFPYAKDRVYTPPEAPLDALLGLQRALRFDRVVIVQPSVYGTDNACTLDAVRRLGPHARGIAVIGKNTSRAQLEDMAAAGIRGVRINIETSALGRPDTARARAVLDAAAGQIHGLDWHIEIHAQLTLIAALKDYLAQLPLAVVFDHFGRPAAQGPDQVGFDALLDLIKTGRGYVTLSGSYRFAKHDLYPDIAPLAQALVKANPERVIWATDWPHPVSSHGRNLAEIAPPYPIDDGLVLNLLPNWVPNPAIRKKILVDNPARLYGFDPV